MNIHIVQTVRKGASVAFDVWVLVVFCFTPLGTPPFLFMPKTFYVAFYIVYYVLTFYLSPPTVVLRIKNFLFIVLTVPLCLNWLFTAYAALQFNLILTIFPVSFTALFLYGVYKNFFSTKLFIFKLFSPFCLFAFLATMYYVFGTVEHNCGKLIQENSVTPIISYCDKKWKNFIGKELKKRTHFSGGEPTPVLATFGAPRAIVTSKNPKYVYLSTGTPNMGAHDQQISFLIQFDRAQRRMVSFLVLPSNLHDLVYDEKRKVLYGVSPTEHKIYIIGEFPFKVIRKKPCIKNPFYSVINSSWDKLFVLSHSGGWVGGYALPSLNEIKKKNIAPELFYVSYSPHVKKLFAAAVFSNDAVYSFDENLNKIQHKKGNPYFPYTLGGSSVALNEKASEVYVSVPFESRIYIYDMKSLNRLGYISVPFGVRVMDFDEDRNFLYAGDYVHGNMLVINPSGQNIVQKIFVGRKIRDVFYSKSAKRLFVASTNGFFEIDPNKF